MLIKVCNVCLKSFPATTEYFHVSKNHKYNLKNTCKNCCSQYAKMYNANKRKSNEFKQKHNLNVKAYRNTYKGNISFKISCIKRSARFHNKVNNNRLTLTTDEFIQIIEKFSHKCSYCGQTNVELIPSMIVRFSHNGNLCKTNTVASCHKCHVLKLQQTKCKSFEQWYQSQPFYSQERYNKILNHIKRE